MTASPADPAAAPGSADAAGTAAAADAPRARRGPYAKSAERRAAIVAAAFEVFAAHGYAGGSLQKVADVVGMSQTSLLHYFPTKSHLLLAVLARRDEVSAGPMPATPAEGSMVEAVVRQARANESVPGVVELYAVLSGEAVTAGNPGRDYVSARLAGLRREFGDAFRGLQAAGLLRPGVDPDRAATALVALWDGLQLQWLLAPDEVDVPGQLRDHLELVVVPEAPAAS
ncbi:TetR/AcrR family transcriptional regulator [Frigoribacterium sp. CFBP 13707]|uniref:TetR/AcrR family transcriptional regulator n=1 Tax=Frigoribacterium sp. CFBP 13707 TaxID=2775313 RepID=UPI00177B3503|nr:TetR/AcrR family transcriptional regulator [Frigoribacterium sp. CFBP 13707]MBD8727778.1 TetR/AcrR family transcriptional regulator [Frigoribacterium sp. CFBP 13707]